MRAQGVGGGPGERERGEHPPKTKNPAGVSRAPLAPDPSLSTSPPSLTHFTAAVLYAAASELLLQPKEYAAFAAALDRVREDPRVTVRLGSPITGYGQEARGRAARQRISHRLRVDGAGLEHITVQFWARGPAGVARVTAEMHKASEAAAAAAASGSGVGGFSPASSAAGGYGAPSSSPSGSDWRYDYMVADVDAPAPQRIVIVAPQAVPSLAAGKAAAAAAAAAAVVGGGGAGGGGGGGGGLSF